MKKRTYLVVVLIILVAQLLTACTGNTALGATSASPAEETVLSQGLGEETVLSEGTGEDITRPEGWDEETHSNETEPDYGVVFPQDEVNRLDITISPENWQTMLSDMTSLVGAFGTTSKRGANTAPVAPAVGGNQPPAGGQQPGNQGQPQDLGNQQLPGDIGNLDDNEVNPIWVPVTLAFEGDTWTNVGLRFKGNSSLNTTWKQGSLNLPLKLDFDEFEDDYPEIDDQRFYGFKQVSLSSNFLDSSYLREKVAADIFREAGVPAAQTAYYQVYVDYGEGSVYFGLYTMVEVVDDTLIETQFEDGSGNVYKPSGAGATFAAGSYNEADYDKETNQDEADYSDIQALYQALHAETRTSDPQTWRTDLEATFDVDGFLQYLAVNNVIQNWDTYGSMNHNYYLYNDPATNLLTWIPWDNNESLSAGKRAVSLSLDEVSDKWPLIRYLMDDPIYSAQYAENVEAVINGAFNPETIIARYQELHDLIRPYIVASQSENGGNTNLPSVNVFDAALVQLIQHAESRYQAVNAYLQSVR